MTGCIYKSDALNVITKLINENKRQYGTSFHKGKRAALIEALEEIEKIKDADVQPVNRWISVEDKLPEATYDCLVWYSCDTTYGKCKSWGIAHCTRCDWYTKHLDGDNIVVLYWMPMPEPPRDGDV